MSPSTCFHTKRYDIVVAADGQGSRTRRLVFGQETSSEAFKSLRVYAAYYTIPWVEGEGGLAKAYNAQWCRLIMTRNGNCPMMQVYLFTMKDTESLKKLNKEPIEKQKEVWAETFKDAGWQCDRLLSGLNTCDNFYAHEVAQVKMKQMYNGRVVLLGDAGYCPNPFTGMGTTASLIGSYVPAGELARHGNDVGGALKAYEGIVRRPVGECQKLPFGLPRVFFPSSQLGIWILRNTFWAISTFKIDQMIHWLLPEGNGGWSIPEYPELNLVL
ncbi:hypothetical protein K469DRAFT_727200 [Zopfia rhizophila CBS 207.26]|uniref:FAD-binding domain-containing protein n=1 Tax=Zopfia rhizophila CBS 207.26 TaxID=1314779 RepID=A0A6A6DYI4_9PEZI|nr:hypothetical protein K469DRAFT_727200 [Zopfia rhizophila CBS 207.26]